MARKKLTYLDVRNPDTVQRAKKCYALTSYAHAMVRDAELNTLKTIALVRQCKLSMNGFYAAVGPKIYMEHTEALADIYTSLNTRFEERITSGESAVMIEIILNLVPKKDMKEFMLMNFNSGLRLDNDRLDMLVSVALELDVLLNELLGTKATATKDSLINIFAEPVKKAKKSKAKKPSKKQLAHEKAVEEAKKAKERKASNLAKLREIAKRARESKEK